MSNIHVGGRFQDCHRMSWDVPDPQPLTLTLTPPPPLTLKLTWDIPGYPVAILDTNSEVPTRVLFELGWLPQISKILLSAIRAPQASHFSLFSS